MSDNKQDSEVRERKRFNYGQCFQSYISKNALQNHVKTQHEIHEPVICPHCNKSFLIKKYLNEHVTKIHINGGIKRFQCDKCFESFTRKTLLQTHVKSKHEIHEPSICNYCNKSFKIQEYLDKHISNVHKNNVIKNHKCDACNQTFKKNQSLKMHIQFVHEKKLPFQCTECEKKFSKKSL